MERNNSYLDSLLKIQEELAETQLRLDALESGRIAPETTSIKISKHATIADFLSQEDIQAINRSFSESLNRKIECDSLDYALACSCGIISGLIDILMVKTPHEGIVGNASDKLFDKAIIALAGKKDTGEERNIASAITSIINSLTEDGLVLPCGSIKNGVGRSRNLLNFNENYALCGAVLFRAKTLRVAVGNMRAKILWESEINFDPVNDSPMKLLSDLSDKLQEGFELCKSYSNSILGIGVGSGSLLTPGSERIYAIHSIDWKDIPIVEYLSTRFQIPIIADTASNNAMMAEKYLGISKNVENAIYLSVGYGIGAGLLVNNKLFHGSRGFAGDIGHMVVEPNGPLCPCGKRGCWEVVASSIIAKKSFRELTESAESGDINAIAMLTQIGRSLGKGIANLINVLNPELVIVGGRSVAAKKWLSTPCRNAAESLVWPIVWEDTRIEFSSFGVDADLIGTITRVVELLF